MGIHITVRRAVFLDRDGVINEAKIKSGKPHPPTSVDELRILPGVPDALGQLRELGYTNIVVTNQPDVSRGITTKEIVQAINEKIQRDLPVDAIFTCWHDRQDYCECRKPKPGMLIQAARQLGIELNQSFMVGDRWSDVDAGQASGCRSIFVDYGYSEPKPKNPDFTCNSLTEAVRWIQAQGVKSEED